MPLSIRSSLARFTAILSIALLAACGDTTPDAASPLAPTATPASTSVTAADSTTGEILKLSDDAPPICIGYLARRDESKAQLAVQPGDEDLIEIIGAYNRFLNENCR